MHVSVLSVSTLELLLNGVLPRANMLPGFVASTQHSSCWLLVVDCGVAFVFFCCCHRLLAACVEYVCYLGMCCILEVHNEDT